MSRGFYSFISLIGLIIVLSFLVFYKSTTANKAYASTCPTSGTLITDSLISAGSTTTGGKIYSTIGTCVIDPKASFVTFKIPSYDDLKSIYYTQVKNNDNVTKHATIEASNLSQSNIPLAGPNDHLYDLDGNLTITGNPTGTQTGVIFVDGNMNINSNLTYGTGTTGLVFVVKGNINISIGVTLVNAVLISEGQICSAYEENLCPTSYSDSITTQPLVVNGSLISLADEDDPHKIIFRRNIADNTFAAERINQQSKYLEILKNLFTQTLSITTEDTNYSINVSDVALFTPSAPQGLTATSKGQNVQLNWSAPAYNGDSPITGYKVYRSLTSGGESDPPLATRNNTTYLDNDVVKGTTYYYQVKATNVNGDGQFSQEVAIEVPTASTPTEPRNLTATAGNGQIVLSWSAPSDNGGAPVTGYKVYRGTTSNGESQTALTTVTSPTYTNSGLPANTLYYYKVTAENKIGESDPSNEANARTYCSGYIDNDHDGYGVGSLQLTSCPGGSLPTGYAANNTDCYDSNANAHPGQTQYFATNRGDGSFNYDCDSSIAHTVTGFANVHGAGSCNGFGSNWCSSNSTTTDSQAYCGTYLATSCNTDPSHAWYNDECGWVWEAYRCDCNYTQDRCR